MMEQAPGKRFIEAAADVQGPQRFQRQSAIAVKHNFAQHRQYGSITPLAKDAPCLAPLPIVGMIEQRNQLLARQPGQIQANVRLRPLGHNFVNPAVRAVPIIDRIDMIGALVVPVGNIDGTVRSGQAIDGTKPASVGDEKIAAETAGETRSLAFDNMPVQRVRKEVSGDVDVAKRIGIGAALIDDAAAGHVSAFEMLIRDMVEVAVGVRIVQRAMLAKTFDVIAALYLMQHGEAAPVRAGEDLAVFVEIESPGVAAAFGE